MTAAAISPDLALAARSEQRVRLAFLDGLRGLAASYVVLHHAYLEVDNRLDGAGLSHAASWWLAWLRYGHYAVALFIVLSGFCLMLPVVRSPERSLRGGTRRYLLRRARRILPPYYAALALSIAIICLVPTMHTMRGVRWDAAIPLTKQTVAAHLLLLHNVSATWGYQIDPPMWSVATEWQIYFLLPLLLLPVWRRAGVLAAVACAFVVGLGPHYLAHAYWFDDACPWYAGLFALGMAAATLTAPWSAASHRCAERLASPALVTALWLVAVTAVVQQDAFPGQTARLWIPDVLVGCAAASLLLFGARAAVAGRDSARPHVIRLLEWRPILWLGAISYSLYLVHFPLLSLLDAPAYSAHWTPAARLAAMYGIGVPLCLAAAYRFHLLFERPFLSSQST